MAETNNRRRRNNGEPTESQKKQAKDFAVWQRVLRERKAAREGFEWRMRNLADSITYSYAQVRLFDEDGYGGIDDTGRYRQPPPEYIEEVVRATGGTKTDLEKGLAFAGHYVTPKALDPKSAGSSDLIRGLNPDEIEVVYMLRGMQPVLREGAVDAVRGMYKGGRTAADILREDDEAITIGKASDRKENPSRVVKPEEKSAEDDAT